MGKISGKPPCGAVGVENIIADHEGEVTLARGVCSGADHAVAARNEEQPQTVHEWTMPIKSYPPTWSGLFLFQGWRDCCQEGVALLNGQTTFFSDSIQRRISKTRAQRAEESFLSGEELG
jgi:hypothetical protein